MTDSTPYDAYHRPLPNGGFACQRLGCSHIDGQLNRAVLLPRDPIQEALDIGRPAPIPAADRTPGPPPF
jgi:hypothetical protein